jgi:hypothetical protein
VIFVAMTLLAMLALATSAAWAGSPHFVGQCNSHDDSLEVFGKDAGLGDESDVNIKVTATALCINSDGHHPKAVNKESVSAEQSTPVQNGKAVFDFTLTPTFEPECSPPMTVEFTDVTVCDRPSSLIDRPIQLFPQLADECGFATESLIALSAVSCYGE